MSIQRLRRRYSWVIPLFLTIHLSGLFLCLDQNCVQTGLHHGCGTFHSHQSSNGPSTSSNSALDQDVFCNCPCHAIFLITALIPSAEQPVFTFYDILETKHVYTEPEKSIDHPPLF